MTTITKFAREDSDLVNLAADMAWGAIKAWHSARDIKPTCTADDCREMAEDVLFDWTGREVDDVAEEVAIEILARQGFRAVDMNAGLLEKN